ncbi:hypothetical protein Taro_055985 [Colocasia esculenta]|uniref:Uncharacterized protein n=1 Tax=Colocasia esculenta TaxID=4460 RepID=A0A843XUG7_COLES|nr:hypothetical protein [Colocasia esculenta]
MREAAAWPDWSCCCGVVFLWRLCLTLLGRRRQEPGWRAVGVAGVSSSWLTSHSWVPIHGGTGVCGFPTSRCVRGLGSGVVLLVGPRPCGGLRWPCLWFTQICHSGVDTVHLCVDTSSLSQKPVLNGSQPVVSTQSICVSTLDDHPRKQSEQLKPVVSTQSA